MQDLKSYTLPELQIRLQNKSYPRFLAKQIFGWVYKKRVEDFDLMTNLSKDTRQRLKGDCYFSQLKLLKKVKSCDGTEKFLFKLKDSSVIETVLIPEKLRNTLCVSTQVGCKFKCIFCESGQYGFKRNLSIAEILSQYLQICDLNKKSKITNIVFMGIGEPLDNFDNIVQAINILVDKQGVSFSKRKITLSTCGLIPEIKKLADLKLGIKLSVSLHSADEKTRGKLMPVNKKYPLGKLMPAIRQFAKKEKYPVTFEYVLISGVNMKKEDAKKLAGLLKGIKAKINLILFNGKSEKFKAPFKEEIESFSEELKRAGAFFTLRKSRGQDIEASCGQLRAEYLNIK